MPPARGCAGWPRACPATASPVHGQGLRASRRRRRRRARARASRDFAQTTIEALAPEAAIRAFRAKSVGGRFSFDWRDTWAEEHAAAFVVAKAMREEVLEILHAGMDEAISNGRTLRQFRDQVRPLLESEGWWGRTEMVDPVTGRREEVELGTPRRLRTIFRTNMMTAYAAGQWEGIEETKAAFPYLEYVAVDDERTRHTHRELDGTILPVDDPFWDAHYPPNDWNCRCDVVQRSAADLERQGKRVTSAKALAASGATRTRRVRNVRTGRVTTVPRSVTPAFAYNAGKSRLAPITPVPVFDTRANVVALRPADGRAPGGEPELPTPRAIADEDLVPVDATETEALRAFFSELPQGMVFDRAGVPIVVNTRMFEARDQSGERVGMKLKKRNRHVYARLMARTLTSPDEIWHKVLRENGRHVTRRTYLSYYEREGRVIPVYVIFENRDRTMHVGVTAVPVTEGANLGKRLRHVQGRARLGTLIYRRRD